MQIRCKSICIQLYFFPHFRYEIWLHWFHSLHSRMFFDFFSEFCRVPFFGLPGLLCTKFVCSSHRPACHSSCRPRWRPHPWLGEGETWHDATWDVGISWKPWENPFRFHTFFGATSLAISEWNFWYIVDLRLPSNSVKRPQFAQKMLFWKNEIQDVQARVHHIDCPCLNDHHDSCQLKCL